MAEVRPPAAAATGAANGKAAAGAGPAYKVEELRAFIATIITPETDLESLTLPDVRAQAAQALGLPIGALEGKVERKLVKKVFTDRLMEMPASDEEPEEEAEEEEEEAAPRAKGSGNQSKAKKQQQKRKKPLPPKPRSRSKTKGRGHKKQQEGADDEVDPSAGEGLGEAQEENEAEEEEEEEEDPPSSESEPPEDDGKDEDWAPEPEPTKRKRGGRGGRKPASAKKKAPPSRRNNAGRRDRRKSKGGRGGGGGKRRGAASARLVDNAAKFDVSGFFAGTLRHRLDDVLAVAGPGDSSSSSSSSSREVAVPARLREAVDPRSGKFGRAHVVEDDAGGAFDALLGMQWRDGATRMLGLQLLEADDVDAALRYEVELRERVWWVFSCEVTVTPVPVAAAADAAEKAAEEAERAQKQAEDGGGGGGGGEQQAATEGEEGGKPATATTTAGEGEEKVQEDVRAAGATPTTITTTTRSQTQLFPFYDLAAAKQYFADTYFNKTGYVFGVGARRAKPNRYAILPLRRAALVFAASDDDDVTGAAGASSSNAPAGAKSGLGGNSPRMALLAEPVDATSGLGALLVRLVHSDAPLEAARRLGLPVAVFGDDFDAAAAAAGQVSADVEIRALGTQIKTAAALLCRAAVALRDGGVAGGAGDASAVPEDVRRRLRDALAGLVASSSPSSSSSSSSSALALALPGGVDDACFASVPALWELASRLWLAHESVRALRVQRRFRRAAADSASPTALASTLQGLAAVQELWPAGRAAKAAEEEAAAAAAATKEAGPEAEAKAKAPAVASESEDSESEDDEAGFPETLWAACDDCDKWRVVSPDAHAALQAGGDDAAFRCGDADRLCEDRQLDDVEGAERFRDMLLRAGHHDHQKGGRGKQAKKKQRKKKTAATTKGRPGGGGGGGGGGPAARRRKKAAAARRKKATAVFERLRALLASSVGDVDLAPTAGARAGAAAAADETAAAVWLHGAYGVDRFEESRAIAAFDHLSPTVLGVEHPRQLLWIATTAFDVQGLAWLATGVVPPPLVAAGVGLRLFPTAAGALAAAVALRPQHAEGLAEASPASSSSSSSSPSPLSASLPSASSSRTACLLFLCEVVVGRAFPMPLAAKHAQPFAPPPSMWYHSTELEPLAGGVADASAPSLAAAADFLREHEAEPARPVECPLLGVPAGTCAWEGGRQVGDGGGAKPFSTAGVHRCVEVFDAAQVRVRYALDVTV